MDANKGPAPQAEERPAEGKPAKERPAKESPTKTIIFAIAVILFSLAVPLWLIYKPYRIVKKPLYVRITLQVDPGKSPLSAKDLEAISRILEERLTSLRLYHRMKVEPPDRIQVYLPGKDPEVTKVLLRRGKLDFKLVVGPKQMSEAAMASEIERIQRLKEEGRYDPIRASYDIGRDLKTGTMLLLENPGVGGRYLDEAYPTFDSMRMPAVGFTLDSTGSKRFYRWTLNNQGRHLAILLDGEVLSAPMIKAPIAGGKGIISVGKGFTLGDVLGLIASLRSEPLPARLVLVESRLLERPYEAE
jgi:preprotein translocase subunit SecD